MNEKLKELAKLIEENPELKEKLDALSQDGNNVVEAHIAACKEYGIDLNKEDLNFTKEEISDEELLAVTGGATQTLSSQVNDYVLCGCCLGGGGDAVCIDGQNFDVCACVVGGYGVETILRSFDEMVGGFSKYGGEMICVVSGCSYR